MCCKLISKTTTKALNYTPTIDQAGWQSLFHAAIGSPELCSKGIQRLCSSGAAFPFWYNSRWSYNWLSLRCESTDVLAIYTMTCIIIRRLEFLQDTWNKINPTNPPSCIYSWTTSIPPWSATSTWPRLCGTVCSLQLQARRPLLMLMSHLCALMAQPFCTQTEVNYFNCTPLLFAFLVYT